MPTKIEDIIRSGADPFYDRVAKNFGFEPGKKDISSNLEMRFTELLRQQQKLGNATPSDSLLFEKDTILDLLQHYSRRYKTTPNVDLAPENLKPVTPGML